MRTGAQAHRFALGLAIGALLASCATEPESDRLVIEITDETGRSLPAARLEVSSDRMGIRVLVADRNGNVVLDDGATDWTLEPRNVDGCPMSVRSRRRGREELRWSIVSSSSLRAKCREKIPYGIRGIPGESVGWRQALVHEQVETGFYWSAILAETTTLDSLGRGILRIPVLLSPFREHPEFRILVRGVAFPLGAWWIDPTDSVFTVLPIRVGGAMSAFSALSRGLVTDRDSLALSLDFQKPALEWWVRGTSQVRRADVAWTDTTFRGVWRDTPTDSFHWVLRRIGTSDGGVVLDTGSGVGAGLWLRPPP